MINVNETTQNLYKQDSISKNLTLTFINPSLVLTNSDIVAGSFQLSQILSDEDSLRFGGCNIPLINITLANFSDDMVGKEFEAKFSINGGSDISIGKFVVAEIKKIEGKAYKTVMAKGAISKLDIDVSSWYNALTFPITVKAFRDSLLNHLNVPFKTVSLVNDSILLTKELSGEIKALRLLKDICELNGCFGSINNQGYFDFKVLSTNAYALDSAILRDKPIYDTFVTKVVDGVEIVDDNGTYVQSNNCSNPYSMSNNSLCYSKVADDLRVIATNLFNAIKTIQYVPISRLNLKGLPFLELGDCISLNADGKVITSYVLTKTTKGIQTMQDSIKARGSELQSREVSNTTELLRRVNNNVVKVESDVNGLTSEVSTTKQIATDAQTSASNAQQSANEAQQSADNAQNTADGIATDLSNNYSTTAEMNSAISQSAESITSTVSKTYATKQALGDVQTSLTTQEQNFANFIDDYAREIENIQAQIDGNITTWFYPVAPTMENAPANEWTTVDVKNQHLGDIYYDTITGYAYRFMIENNSYKWEKLEDSDVTKALEDASKAQDTADSKRRVFVSQPKPPYDIGDLWVQGTNGDIMRCQTNRVSGNYVASDWVKSNKYTDDTKANEVANNLANNYSTTTQMNSAISQSAESITSTVSKTYATITTVNSVKDTADSAVETANSASATANSASQTASTANTNASTALSTANTANSTANTASKNASSAVSTANTASQNASNAVNTANTANTNSQNAVNTANNAKNVADAVAEDLATNYTTTVEMNSAINQRADSITSTVSATYTTKVEMETTIDATEVQYYLSTSTTSLSGGTWQSTAPQWAEGKYMWQRTKLTYHNGDIEYKPSINGTCVAGATGQKGDKGDKGDQGPQGLQGIQGPKGDQGIQGPQGDKGNTTYFHIKYSAVANPTSASQMTETPSTYIGTYVDTTPTDSTNPSSYTWARFQGVQGPKGDQGIPGVGTDGKTSYLHIKYSNDGGSTFTSNNGEDVGKWIGTCTDFNQNDPTTVGAYKWAKIEGEQGPQGTKGDKGADGTLSWTPVLTNVTRNGSTFTKTAGGNAWNASVHSKESFSEGCYVSTQISAINGYAMFGLTTTPDADASHQAIDYVLYFTGTRMAIYERGTYIATYEGATFTTSSVGKVIYDGIYVYYYLDSTLLRKVKRTSTAPLYLDSSIHTLNLSFVNMVFGTTGSTKELVTSIETAQSEIKQTADQIALKVSKGDVSSQLSVETDQITIGSNRLVVNATNFTLNADGTLTCKNANVEGQITAKSGSVASFNIQDTTIFCDAGGDTLSLGIDSNNRASIDMRGFYGTFEHSGITEYRGQRYVSINGNKGISLSMTSKMWGSLQVIRPAVEIFNNVGDNDDVPRGMIRVYNTPDGDGDLTSDFTEIDGGHIKCDSIRTHSGADLDTLNANKLNKDWKLLGSYANANNVSISSIFDNLSEIMILATYASNSTSYTPLHWAKTMGSGTFLASYFYSMSYYATFAFEINLSGKYIKPNPNWYKIINNNADNSSYIKYWVYYR